ncbi:LysR family transcriptional regulator [Janibacter corallicola]|uniref:LysR family transcriptional regulator n=1 Tax=Janibacter corallicola TaxID=415212 RepID=UPI0008306499|nr:LysR family transcriptional regulator [Janibacter corallicola]
MIDVRLRMLEMVARHGTVTGGAEALQYSPSTVSQRIGQLAQELRVDLLERHGRNVRLTPAALTLLEHVDVMSREWERARADLDAYADSVQGVLTVCGFSTAASVLLPPVMRSLVHRYPHMDTRMVEAEPAECYDLVLAGEADVGVVVVTASTPPRTEGRFAQHHLLEDPLDLVVPQDHPLAGKRSASIVEAAGEDWIIGCPGSTYHQLVTASCAAAGFTPNIAHHADEWETGIALVSAGFGVCVVSRLSRWPDLHPVARIPLSGENSPSRRIAAVTRAGAQRRRPVAHALAELARVAEELATR